MPITRIIRLDNRSTRTVSLLNIENESTKGHGDAVPPGGRLDVDMFVPWAATADAFPRQHLEVAVDGTTRFWIWQAAQWDGDHLRYSRNGTWMHPGPRVHGISAVDPRNGDRTLVVHDECIEVVDLPDDFVRDVVAGLPPRRFGPSEVQPVDDLMHRMPSVPRRRASAFSMAGPPSDAGMRRIAGARFGYTDSGKRYVFEVRSDGVVTARHPDGTLTELRDAISYDESRRGRTFAAPAFDMVAANDGRVIAKARGSNQLFFATIDHLFVHGDDTGFETTVPSMYFKIDPEFGRTDRRASDLTDHMRGCFADHPAVERFPLFRLALGLDIADMMVVRVVPRVWHLIDIRPPLGPFEAMLPLMTIAETALEHAERRLPPWPLLDGVRAALADWRANAAAERARLEDPAYDPYLAPSWAPTYPHVQYTDGTRTLTFSSIRYHRVLDIGAGHAHWHAVYDGSTGGEMQPMRTGPALGPLSWADLYRLVNGPIRDGDGYIDGTANFYALVQLKPDTAVAVDTGLTIDGVEERDGLTVGDAYAIVYADEQTQFSGRWRLLHPDDHVGGGFALVSALVSDHERPDPLYDWRPAAYWCPFRAGHITRRSRMAVSRQVVVVNGVDPVDKAARLFSINFSYASMDRSWRWRSLPPGAKVAYLSDEALADEKIPATADDVVYPQTVRLREDMTLHLRGTKGGVPGRWYQRYLPSSNTLVPAGAQLTGGRPARGFSHQWRFVAEPAFAVADTFSHLGVYDTVDTRSQYYDLALPPESAAVLEKSSGTRPWVDDRGQLFVRAVRFYWAAPLREPDHQLDARKLSVRPARKVPPSIMNSVTRLRIVKRGSRWIAVHWDKRDDDLMPFDPIEDAFGAPANPQPPVRLVQDGTAVSVTVGRNVHVEQGPIVPAVEFVWTGDAAAPVALRLRGAERVWRVRMAAVEPASSGAPARVVQLLTAETSRFATVEDGVRELRWKPTDPEIAALRRYCTATASSTYGTSVWCEDLVGHVVVPDRMSWLHSMTATATPAHVPIGLPVTITVHARDTVTGAVVAGADVVVGGRSVGRTGTAFTTTLAMETVRIFDPEIRAYVPQLVPPTMTVRGESHVGTTVPLSVYHPSLSVTVEQSWLPVGRPAQLTVRAVDAVTRAAVAGRVVVAGVDVGATNVPFTYTCGATPPSASVTAPHYPAARVPWPPLRVPRLVLAVQPLPVPLRTAVSITVRATDADTGAPVNGTVFVNGTAAGRTNVAFTHTFMPTRKRVFDPEIRAYTYEFVMPTGQVTASGYAPVAIDFGW